MTTSNQGFILWLTLKTAHIGTVLCDNILGVMTCSRFAVKNMICEIANVSSWPLQISPKASCSPILPKFCPVSFSQTHAAFLSVWALKCQK